MLEHVEQRYEVIGVALEHREVGQPRILDLAAESLAGERPRRPVELARLDLSKSAEHREVVPGATADFEQARFLRRAGGAAQQPGGGRTARSISRSRMRRRARNHQCSWSSSAIRSNTARSMPPPPHLRFAPIH